jgi:hypothetical protein
MIIETRLLPPGAIAVTIWPLILVHPSVAKNARVLRHEGVHFEDQRRWFIYGLGVGLLVWWLLYLLALPVGWNPMRSHAERRAMRAEGRRDDEIRWALRKAPYYLWWH